MMTEFCMRAFGVQIYSLDFFANSYPDKILNIPFFLFWYKISQKFTIKKNLPPSPSARQAR